VAQQFTAAITGLFSELALADEGSRGLQYDFSRRLQALRLEPQYQLICDDRHCKRCTPV
jgi:hypothetical protein